MSHCQRFSLSFACWREWLDCSHCWSFPLLPAPSQLPVRCQCWPYSQNWCSSLLPTHWEGACISPVPLSPCGGRRQAALKCWGAQHRSAKQGATWGPSTGRSRIFAPVDHPLTMLLQQNVGHMFEDTHRQTGSLPQESLKNYLCLITSRNMDAACAPPVRLHQHQCWGIELTAKVNLPYTIMNRE